MRLSTAIILLAIILLFAVYGWKALGVVLTALLLLPLLLLLAGLLFLWWMRRRMRRAALEFQQQLRARMQAVQEHQRQAAVRQDAIDADFEPKP